MVAFFDKYFLTFAQWSSHPNAGIVARKGKAGKMRKIANIMIVILCTLMQIATTMPHHHHGDSNTVCLNYTHLEHSHNDCHTAGHDHSHDHASICNNTPIELAEPELHTTRVPVEECLTLAVPTSSTNRLPQPTLKWRTLNFNYSIRDRIHFDPIRIFFTRALPVRAPQA